MGRLLTLHGGQFNFQALPGLFYYHDPSDIATLTFNGGNVSQAADKSRSGLVAVQANGPDQPLYEATKLNGRPGLTYANDMLQVDDSPLLDYPQLSMYFVIQNNLDTGTSALRFLQKWGGGAPNLEFLFNFTNNTTPDTINFGFSSNGTANSFSNIDQPTLGTVCIVDVQYSGTDTKVTVNNNPATTKTIAGAIFNGSSPLQHGATFGGGNFTSGKVLMCNQLHSAATRLATMRGLSSHYGTPIA